MCEIMEGITQSQHCINDYNENDVCERACGLNCLVDYLIDVETLDIWEGNLTTRRET